MNSRLRGFAKSILPSSLYRSFVRLTRNPPVGRVDFGDLRQPRPISDVWGLDRGRPVDRYYIEQFLGANAHLIQGHVLEIGNNTYTRQFGGERVTRSDVLHISPESPNATIIADLTNADHVESDSFDCIICTQTIHLIYEIDAAIATLSRIVKPGGIVLVTVPGISQISRYDMDRWGDFWRFTSASIERLFKNTLSFLEVEVTVFGNVLAAIAFLHGVAAEELTPQELELVDPDYQLLLAVKARKARE
jgi:SAM-dependent methyltransferase